MINNHALPWCCVWFVLNVGPLLGVFKIQACYCLFVLMGFKEGEIYINYFTIKCYVAEIVLVFWWRCGLENDG